MQEIVGMETMWKTKTSIWIRVFEIGCGDNFFLCLHNMCLYYEEIPTWKPRNEHLQILSYRFIQGSCVENIFGKNLLSRFGDVTKESSF